MNCWDGIRDNLEKNQNWKERLSRKECLRVKQTVGYPNEGERLNMGEQLNLFEVDGTGIG